ncbi:hypothetical protein EPUS_01210 [Endocarpon pusillum Z07020]|uniref:Gfo/Idh/MocA-like oxidoreductase N-terminal domain-containing protein n=1 Tax=Endocarpon pusillum (strain Z07020 / HMAS-L-300199) TaxID=1263415 RepID=U1I1N4_ENDPU|nr:uncharacterized protein EPUS_01210 [Endocarpon pusillum Z07020]ERF75844.1 hypothetical protein EPUS_01210 [Endocarpon pusillum Z07020]
MQYATRHRRLSSTAQSNFAIPKSTIEPDEIFKAKSMDVVFILTSDEYHTLYTIAAIQAGKHFMLEKVMTLSLPSAKKTIEAKKAANGLEVFVAYMRSGPGTSLNRILTLSANQAPFRRISQTICQNPTIPDFATGETVGYIPPDEAAVDAAFQRSAAEVVKYPGVQAGYELTDPVPENSPLPFGQLIEKYDLGALSETTLANFATKAANELGSDALLSTTIMTMDRSTTPARVLVQTLLGRKLILAKKIISTVPHNLNNLPGFDLSSHEEFHFAQFDNSAFYTGVLQDTGLRTNTSIHAFGSNKPYGIPGLPGIYSLNPNAAIDLF